MRVGIGYDIHSLRADRRLMLGGIEIPYSKGLEGHSDGDVLLHAICDALLGGAGLGDIGEHFPDNDMAYKDISSIELLKKVAKKVSDKGYAVNNIDGIIVAEEPRLGPFKEKMGEKIAVALTLEREHVNIKATTMEGLGPIGHREAIAAYAAASLKEVESRE